MTRRKQPAYAFQSLDEVKAEHTAHIVQMLRAGWFTAAGQALDTLCVSIKDLKGYEAFMLARKIAQEAGDGDGDGDAIAGVLLGRAIQTATSP